MELTLLTEGQVFGNDREKQLEVLRKYGTRSAISDLAILTGATAYNAFVPDDDSLKGRTGWSCIKGGAKGYSRGYDSCYCFGVDDDHDMIVPREIYTRESVIRPVLLSSSFSQISSSRMKGYNGTEEVEFGEYSQYAPKKDVQQKLENEYKNKNLQKIKSRGYTFDERSRAHWLCDFLPENYDKYEYHGRKYIRVRANFADKFNVELSNGELCNHGDYVWVEVSPVKWLIDDETQMLISKIGLLSGIRFYAPNKEYNGDFSTSEMKEYLDKYMIKDLFQSTILNHTADMTSTELKENINPVEDMTPKELLAEATAEFRKILAKVKK